MWVVTVISEGAFIWTSAHLGCIQAFRWTSQSCAAYFEQPKPLSIEYHVSFQGRRNGGSWSWQSADREYLCTNPSIPCSYPELPEITKNSQAHRTALMGQMVLMMPDSPTHLPTQWSMDDTPMGPQHQGWQSCLPTSHHHEPSLPSPPFAYEALHRVPGLQERTV